MKIVQALGWYYPDRPAGTEIYVEALCRRLRAFGHEVLVAAPDAGCAEERTYEHEGVIVYRYPVPPAPTRAECQARVPVRGAERFHAWLRRLRPDVVHAHTFVTGLGLHELRAGAAAGARVIVTTHSSALGYVCQRGTLMRWGREPCDGISAPAKCAACALAQRGLPAPLARALGSIPPTLGRVAAVVPGRLGTALSMSDLIAWNQSLQRETLELVDGFVVLTDEAFQMLAHNGAPPDKLRVNRLGISQNGIRRKPGPEQRPTGSPITIGYLGRFDQIKGVHDLARAVTAMPRDLALRVEFRGPIGGAAEQRVRAEAERLLRADDRVSFAPAVAPEDSPRILAGYDVLCCPSICHEGGPTVAIESRAVGTPVVGTRIGGLAELIRDGVDGRLVRPGNWRELARVLEDIARDPAATIDRWRAALPESRTMDDVAADYLALYAA